MTKALEVTIDGKIIGVYVPGAGRVFSASLGNYSETCMEGHVHSGSDKENWYWQLPDINEGQIISLRIIETSEKGVPPQRVEPKRKGGEEE
ncbi:MAG: hypothetical protein P4L53_24445 [Candidatus Obscuribacterales bacterium]|nr:hypothetical protein [Candidatus Obscuribacterales bacterium]